MSYVSRKNWKSRSTGLGYSKKSSIRIREIIFFFIILFLVFEIITSMFMISYKVESISMEPTIPSGSVLLATPLIYGPEIPFISFKMPGFKKPVRGDIVVSTPNFHRERTWYIKVVDSFIRFFTAQKKGFVSDGNNWVNSRIVKRVLGVPGDTVMMNHFEIFIKPAGKNYFFSENVIMQVEYSTDNFLPPELITDELPLSGSMEEITLKDDEYFLAGDNRSMSNDSYYWGPVKINSIKAKVLLEYAPEIKMLQ